MQVGDLVWMPPDDRSGAVPVESELVCGLILSEPQRHRSGKGPLRVRVLWTEPDGDTSIDWEPADWLKPLSFV